MSDSRPMIFVIDDDALINWEALMKNHRFTMRHSRSRILFGENP